MWNERYSKPGYLYGTDPAAILTAQSAHLPLTGSVLSVAEGEGRNAVHLAGKGLDVTGFDSSHVAVEKARSLAAASGVRANFTESTVGDWDWDAAQYDLVLAIFCQFVGPAERAEMFNGMKRACKPGGMVLVHGFTPKQLVFRTGGPRELDHLYTPDMLADAFAGWEIVRLESYEQVIEEGRGHRGRAALIDFIARKPA